MEPLFSFNGIRIKKLRTWGIKSTICKPTEGEDQNICKVQGDELDFN